MKGQVELRKANLGELREFVLNEAQQSRGRGYCHQQANWLNMVLI